MAADSSAKVVLRDVAVVGGGCYGTFYAGQLIQARERGKAEYRRLLVIDRDPDCRFARELGPGDDRELVVEDWDRFFDRWLARDDDGGGDAIVPSPLMPHLMFAWLSRRARARWPGRGRCAQGPAPCALPGRLRASTQAVAPRRPGPCQRRRGPSR